RSFQEVQKEQQQTQAKQVVVAQRQRSSQRPSAEQRRRKARLEEVETLIASLEAHLDTLARKLESPPSDIEKVEKLGQEYVRVQKELDALLEEWGGLQEAVEG
ncbi:MAG: ABC transporter C-terminal domain-containing protein, partial [Anaerolineales bacterium]